MFLNDGMKSDKLYWKGDVVLSNENKKAWISLVVPVMYIIVVFFLSERVDILATTIMALPFFLVMQFFLTKYLNRKFPSSEDLKD